MIYLVLAVLFLHIISAPIVFGADFSLSTEKRVIRFGAHVYALPVFSKRVDFDTVERALYKKDKSAETAEKTEKAGNKIKANSALVEAVKRLLLRINVRRLALDGSVGLSDAAVCAVVCSTVNIMYSQACAYFHAIGTSGLAANNNGITEVAADGIFSLTIADIIIVLLKTVFTRSFHEKPSRRVQRAPD